MRLVLYSGGVDSTTALFWSMQTQETHALLFVYPSRNNAQELAHARAICEAHRIAYHTIDASALFAGFASGLLAPNAESGAIVHGKYDADALASLVVPFRNGIFLSIASGLAQSLGASEVVLANHAGDHPIYPDCTSAFIDSMGAAIASGTGGAVRLLSPFCALDKAAIVKMGIALNIDYAQTYSCYEGGARHCQKCPTCLESLEAFVQNGLMIER